jgi:hypothetical protein
VGQQPVDVVPVDGVGDLDHLPLRQLQLAQQDLGRGPAVNQSAGGGVFGGSRRYDTVQAGLDYMATQLDPAHMTAVVVLTDGDDNASKPGSLDALVKAETVPPAGSAVRLFTIAQTGGSDDRGRPYQAGTGLAQPGLERGTPR